MCVICQIEGQDWKFRNGPRKSGIFHSKFYNFYQEKVAKVNLCHCHSYELFLLGERRFLENYPKLVQEMIQHKKNYLCREPASTF